ncbi:hypothetical protein Tco_1438127 [Tanacetum coccineum]
MMMCKQAEQGVPLQAEQADWLADTDEEIDEQELEAHYSFMAKIQEVLPEESSSTEQPLEQVQNNDENNVFANERQHSENNTAECADERVALANLIANLTLDTEENKTILKQLKKANASLTQELEKCKTNLDETSRALGEATSCRDSCLIALQNKQNELEKYIAFNDRTIDYDILQTKLNETLGLLARKDIDIKEGLKTKAYEISVVNQKHDELVKRSLLTKSQFEGQLKEKSKVILDLKVKEEKDIDKMIEMDKQLKFLNEIVYTRNQSIQTIHMLAPKCSTYNGRPTFANPRYLKKAQSEKPYLYEIPYDTSDLANRFAPNREETMTLANESRSKLNKDYVKPYDYTRQNSLYEIFKATLTGLSYQLETRKRIKECECLAQKLLKQTESVNKEVHNKLLKSFAKLENHSISLELALQYIDLKAQMQDKNIAISELKKLIEKCKGKSVETQFDKPSVVRQPNAQRIPKPSVLGKPTPFSNSPEMRSFQTKQSVNKTNVSDGMYRISTTTTQSRTPQLPHASRNTNPHVSKSTGVNHYTSVSRPQLKCYQVKDKVEASITIFSLLVNSVECGFEVAFRKSTCFCESSSGRKLIYLTGNRVSDLPPISLQETTSSTPNLVSWLKLHQLKHGLPKLKYVKDQICSSCEMSKAKRSSFKSKAVPSSKGRLNLLHMDLCGPMRCPLLTDARVLEQDTYVYFKEKALSSDFHSSKLNRTALSKDETALLLRLLEQCSQLLSFHYHFLAEAVATASNGFTQNSLVPQGQKASYYDNSDPVPPRKNVVPRAEKTDLSHQGLEFPLQVLLLIEEYYTPSHNQAEENKQ